MAQEITDVTKSLADQTNIKNNIILVIRGIPFIFGSRRILAFWRIGDPEIKIGDPGLEVGGQIELPNSRPYISLDGTTNNITSQIEIDKGGAGSIQRFNLNMVDKSGELTEIFRPGNYVTDLLGVEAEVFLLFDGGTYPEDATRLFSGTIDAHESGAGNWKLGIAHPDTLKRAEIFEEVAVQLDGMISAGDTVINLTNTDNIVLPGDAVTSFVRIDDEIISFTGITGLGLDGVVRGVQNTVAASHDDETEVTSFYRLTGTAIELALKLMLSNDGNLPFETEVPALAFNQVTPAIFSADSFIVSNTRFQIDNNLVEGDLVTITGATNPANDITDGVITQFEVINDGTIITIFGAGFVSEIGSSALVDFKSSYNVLPAGAGVGMNPRQVDVVQHEFIQDTFGASFPVYEIPIKETFVAKDLLVQEIYFPSGLISVPRGGRSSVVFTAPPLVLDTLVRLTENNVRKPDQLTIKRSINENFYNSIVYRFSEDSIEDKFLAGEVTLSAKSTNRIQTPTKALRIDSKGLQDNPGTVQYIKNQSRRYNDRFQFAAETVKVQPIFGDTFNLDVADVVLFGNSNLQVADIEEGTREFIPRLFDIVNKSVDLKAGNIILKLLDTKQGISDARFGVVSPNSKTDSGSTTTRVKITPSFGNVSVLAEKEKWENFVGQKIKIRNDDWTFNEDVIFFQFDSGDDSALIVSALSVAPPAGYIVDLPDYPTSTDPAELAIMKTIHVFFDPRVEIVTGPSSTTFTVAPADIAKFLVGAFVRVHSFDFSDDSLIDSASDDIAITDVDAGTFTVTVEDMGFTPAAGYLVDLIGFADAGQPYRLI